MIKHMKQCCHLRVRPQLSTAQLRDHKHVTTSSTCGSLRSLPAPADWGHLGGLGASLKSLDLQWGVGIQARSQLTTTLGRWWPRTQKAVYVGDLRKSRTQAGGVKKTGPTGSYLHCSGRKLGLGA